MPGFRAGAADTLDRYRSLLDRIDEAAHATGAAGRTGACGSCSACCGPLPLLALEAYALLAAGLLDGRSPTGDPCPLFDDGDCAAGDERPFACRVRGLPARHLDAEGDWIASGCPPVRRAGSLGAEPPPAPLAEWAALLFHLDREFRAQAGLPPGRTTIAELCRAPGRYRALLPAVGVRPFVSRVVT